MNTEFYLKNPPIKEVALALYITSADFDSIFIEKFKNNILQDYPEILSLQTFNISIKDGKEISVSKKDNINSYSLSNTTKTEIWNVDINRILFSDKNKYEDFDNFLEKFVRKYSFVYSNLKEDAKVSLLALRYSNEFSFSFDKLQEIFSILPLFQQNYNNEFYASNISHMNVANIVNVNNERMTSLVNTMFRVNEVDNTKIIVNFDIEVKYNIDNANIMDIECLKRYLMEMRLFKNKIFFANFPKAKEVFN